MYIRLNVTTLDPDSRRPQGILFAARTLADEGDVNNAEAEAINALIAWFNEHLPTPPKPKPRVLSHRATFWFWKCEKSLPVLEKAWELARLLQMHKAPVQVWRTPQCPGSIVWQDDFQCAIIIRDQTKGRETYVSRPLCDDTTP